MPQTDDMRNEHMSKTQWIKKCVKKVLKYFILIFFIFIVMPVMIMCCTHIFPNNLKAKSLIKRIEQLPQLEDSRKLNDFTYVGWVSGAGKGCKMIGGVLYGIKDTSNVEQHFNGLRIMGVDPPYKADIDTLILKVSPNSGVRKKSPNFDNQELNERILALEKHCRDVDACYFVYSYDVSSWTMDIRCY